jgi:hypothetical protein
MNSTAAATQGNKRITAFNSDGVDLRSALLIIKGVAAESDAVLVLHSAGEQALASL